MLLLDGVVGDKGEANSLDDDVDAAPPSKDESETSVYRSANPGTRCSRLSKAIHVWYRPEAALAERLAALLKAATGESMPLLGPPSELEDEPANEVNERSAMLGRAAWPRLPG